MATMLGPDMVLRTPTMETFDAADLAMDGLASQDSPTSSPQISPRTQPPPNPPFTFPMRSGPSSAPSSYSRATGRRPKSTMDMPMATNEATTREKRPARSPALPAFSFNPGASLSPPLPETSFLSPPQTPASPLSPKTIPKPSNHGHKRGGSEFVGGNIRSGDSITVMSTSPTRSESGLASPKLNPSNPRRHAHRRSAAISSHDLSSMILPSPKSPSPDRGSSAPSSPAAFEQIDKQYSFPGPKGSPSHSEPNLTTSTGVSASELRFQESIPSLSLQPSASLAPRTRVGFSDTLEFIPRPLSLVSNDTSSTVTVRPGHSVSGSLSSIVSTHLDRETSPIPGPSSARKSMEKPTEGRPSTAGAILERTDSLLDVQPELASPRRRGSIPQLGALPPQNLEGKKSPVLTPIKTPKRWSFFGLEPFVASSPTRSRPVSAGSSDSQPKASPSSAASVQQTTDLPTDNKADAVRPKPVRRSSKTKKQRKVKTWAGSILSRKAKPRHSKKMRGPTPPPNVDIDDTVDDLAAGELLSVGSMFDRPMPTLMVTEEDSTGGNGSSWKPPRPVSLPDDDTSYQMIDLDAALGPFATPLGRNPEWEAAQRAGGFAKKQLHSAAGMRGFSGPGMHYHRRAESAPEMVPFEAGRFGIHRFGSSSTMADVFEEDEEDEDTSSEGTGQSTPLAETPKLEQMPLASMDNGMETSQAFIVPGFQTTPRPVQRRISNPDTVSHLDMNESPRVVAFDRTSPGETVTESPLDHQVAFAEDFVGSDAMNTAMPSPGSSIKSKELTPVDLGSMHPMAAPLGPISPYSLSQSSALPSPRSPMSYDPHRVSTAPSSITEDNFQSLLMGEPGPEVRISVDIDIPSLTSSNSTMTRESILAHNPQARYPPLSDQPRPASFTSTAFGRRRSSLASLSRLISTSHGERSKLSMEVPMDSEPDKKAKGTKAKRLSRMMQFWKPKEKGSA